MNLPLQTGPRTNGHSKTTTEMNAVYSHIGGLYVTL